RGARGRDERVGDPGERGHDHDGSELRHTLPHLLRDHLDPFRAGDRGAPELEHPVGSCRATHGLTVLRATGPDRAQKGKKESRPWAGPACPSVRRWRPRQGPRRGPPPRPPKWGPVMVVVVVVVSIPEICPGQEDTVKVRAPGTRRWAPGRAKR